MAEFEQQRSPSPLPARPPEVKAVPALVLPPVPNGAGSRPAENEPQQEQSKLPDLEYARHEKFPKVYVFSYLKEMNEVLLALDPKDTHASNTMGTTLPPGLLKSFLDKVNNGQIPQSNLLFQFLKEEQLIHKGFFGLGGWKLNDSKEAVSLVWKEAPGNDEHENEHRLHYGKGGSAHYAMRRNEVMSQSLDRTIAGYLSIVRHPVYSDISLVSGTGEFRSFVSEQAARKAGKDISYDLPPAATVPQLAENLKTYFEKWRVHATSMITLLDNDNALLFRLSDEEGEQYYLFTGFPQDLSKSQPFISKTGIARRVTYRPESKDGPAAIIVPNGKTEVVVPLTGDRESAVQDPFKFISRITGEKKELQQLSR